jgi:hypothetical protein
MAKIILPGLVVAAALSGCIQSPEHADCIKIAQYVAHRSGIEGISSPPMMTDHEYSLAEGMITRGIGKFVQHAYLEAYSVCQSVESGNGVKAGRL